ncbi:MAG: DUF2460 domain-containing protein [Candidatus Accumulibacter sp.]|uniref:DUF2460 domain-containing protein n=1 Tax=Candidatus Accumulibacter affinis TaxID=2954384 RepID=A0A935TBW7_9PROT|nr:DUF2460 domain-containing protein [Candidatus Accumulibacter affinis]
MADFLEERIAAPISYASSWSDEFAVEITRTASGAEYRRLLHPYPVRRFRLHLEVDREQMFVKILGLYFRVFGRYAGFRAKAIDDFSTAANGRDAPSMLSRDERQRPLRRRARTSSPPAGPTRSRTRSRSPPASSAPRRFLTIATRSTACRWSTCSARRSAKPSPPLARKPFSRRPTAAAWCRSDRIPSPAR